MRGKLRGLCVPIAGMALLSGSGTAWAQRGTGHGSRPLICVHDCTYSTNEARPEDDLKDFNRIMAVQATADQSTAFASVVRDTESGSAQLQKLRTLLQQEPRTASLTDSQASFDQAVGKARTGLEAFVASFSQVQRVGLRDLTKRLEEADSDLQKQIGILDESVKAANPNRESVADMAANVDKALANFEKEQLALGGEMGIILPSTELTFNLPLVTNSVGMDGTTLSIPASGSAERVSAVNGRNLFALKFVADLSEFQDDLTQILRTETERAPVCGERVETREATLTPRAPAGDVLIRLHLEHWICPPGAGPTELAAGEGSLEVKLLPSIGKDGSLGLTSETSRVEGNGFVHDSLSGSVGDTLRDVITASLLAAMKKGVDAKTILPSVAQGSATIQKAEFQDTAGRLSLVLDGQMEFSDDQTNQFALQLKQRVSAQTAGQ